MCYCNSIFQQQLWRFFCYSAHLRCQEVDWSGIWELESSSCEEELETSHSHGGRCPFRLFSRLGFALKGSSLFRLNALGLVAWDWMHGLEEGASKVIGGHTGFPTGSQALRGREIGWLEDPALVAETQGLGFLDLCTAGLTSSELPESFTWFMISGHSVVWRSCGIRFKRTFSNGSIIQMFCACLRMPVQ